MSTYPEAALISEISGADCHIAPLSRVTSREVQPHEQTTCSHGIPLKQMFLVLAPVTSTSYPAQPPAESRSASDSAPETKTETFDVEPVKKERRSSSVSSGASGKYRFLKLGPVHFGGNPDELDYVELPDQQE